MWILHFHSVVSFMLCITSTIMDDTCPYTFTCYIHNCSHLVINFKNSSLELHLLSQCLSNFYGTQYAGNVLKLLWDYARNVLTMVIVLNQNLIRELNISGCHLVGRACTY